MPQDLLGRAATCNESLILGLIVQFDSDFPEARGGFPCSCIGRALHQRGAHPARHPTLTLRVETQVGTALLDVLPCTHLTQPSHESAVILSHRSGR